MTQRQWQQLLQHIRAGLAVLLLLIVCASGMAQDVTDYYKKPYDGGTFPAKGRYDYGKMARDITVGCATDYERLRAIYQWICANIDYDTSYKIRTADECLRQRKGVCQAYCDLFVLLAQSLGIRVEVVDGKAKDQSGYVNPAGHGWLFGYTRPDHGILMDPTWGAGSVEGSRFVRDTNCWTWFNPSPEWMAMSHFPLKADYQLLDKRLTEKEFLALSPAKFVWADYGLDARRIFNLARNMQLAMPKFYNEGEGRVSLLEVPLAPSLRVGLDYTFRIKMADDRSFGIINNGIFCQKEEWRDEGNGIYSIDFMPRETEALSFCIRDDANSSWSTIVRYDIEPPTALDWAALERRHPAYLPEMQAVGHMNAGEWTQAGVNEHQLLQAVRNEHITELPVLYDGKGQLLRIVSVPMKGHLQVGTEYSFSFIPQGGLHWLLSNGTDTYSDWKVQDKNLHVITVTPRQTGKLILFVQLAQGEGYWPCLEYDVE